MKSTLKRKCLVFVPAALVFGMLATLAQEPAQTQTPKPKHVNRAIEILEKGQPIYYTGSHSGTEGTYEQGKKDAQTWADYISYDMEHAPFDVKGLSEYMKGLAAGGPTKDGHRTPAVIVNVPVNGTSEEVVRANAWMFQQVLATGVHGVMLTHADTPGAIRAFIEACRFPNREQGVGKEGLQDGRRGVHGNPTAAQIWGVSQAEYEQKADPWPLNPHGELLLGVKEEDRYALANVEPNLKIPGLAFAEWGSGDMALSLGVHATGRGRGNNTQNDPRLQDARSKVFAAVKANHLFFLNAVGPANCPGAAGRDCVVDLIKQGVMIISGNQQAVEVGRKFSNNMNPY
jgi:4-hydroxy-2-oxoheptanedioate aldolase